MDASDNVYVLDSGAGRHPDAPAGALWKLTSDLSRLDRVRVFDRDADGDVPLAVIASADGWLYGLNAEGGPARASDGEETQGTVWRVRPDGTGFKVLHAFVKAEQGAPGPDAMSTIVDGEDGYLYGTTYATRANQLAIVYRVKKEDGEFQQLHRFNNTVDKDGFQPGSTLVLAPDSNIYGTTRAGGQYGSGTVFRIVPSRIGSPSGGFESVFSFQGDEEGQAPGGLMLGLDGNLYGMAEGGSQGEGLVFRLGVEHAKPMLKAFMASSPQVVLGAPATLSTSTLSWSADNADACDASGDWSASNLPATGEAEVTPARTGENTYTLTCRNGSEPPVVRSLAITALPAVAITAFTVSAAEVVVGGSLQLDWSVANAESCEASGDWSGTRAASGSETVALTAVREYRFTLVCLGGGGDTVSVTREVRATTEPDDGSGITSGSGAVSPLLLVLAGLLGWRRRARC